MADAQHTWNLPGRKSDMQERQRPIKLQSGRIKMFARTRLGDPMSWLPIGVSAMRAGEGHAEFRGGCK
jgi:hypothetical protein